MKTLICVFATALCLAGQASAASTDVTPDPLDPKVHVRKEKVIPGSESRSESSQQSDISTPSTSAAATDPWEYEWRTACPGGSTELSCAAARACPDPGQTQWLLYGRPVGSATWQIVGSSCGAVPPPVPTGPNAAPPRPQVTPGLVLREVRTLGLPKVRAQVQPAGQTLVNFDTIFYAQKPSFERTVDLLGYTVDVVAEPTQYRWVHGDGTTATTTSPGAPYPSKQITHRYSKRATHDARVDVTYRVRFRVDGGAWETIPETLTATGPATAVTVREAAPVLVS